MAKAKKSKLNILLRIVAFIAIFITAFSLLDGQVKLSEATKERQVRQEQLDIKKVENKEQERRLQNRIDEEQLERIAREELDFVKENERAFVDQSVY